MASMYNGSNTVAILVGDLGPHNVVHNVQTVHKVYRSQKLHSFIPVACADTDTTRTRPPQTDTKGARLSRRETHEE
jgi:hypothetical protein